ncbi:DNA cytosine methyltransferase [Saliphagus sp. GCM10025308]
MGTVEAVDLFCGAGGFTLGLQRAGIDVVAGVDEDLYCVIPYFRNNDAQFYRRDLSTIATENPEWVADLYSDDTDVRVLAGGPPCQPYSNLGNIEGVHDKTGLVSAFATIVDRVQPDIVAMENVPGVSRDPEYEGLIETFRDAGYYVNLPENRDIDCLAYGVPQRRKRWITLASKIGPIEMDSPSRTEVDVDREITAESFIGHLPAIDAGEHHPDDPLHVTQNLRKQNLDRIRISEPGGDWTDWVEKGREDLVADCHTKESGASFKAPYSRMQPDKPAPTITTQFYSFGSGRFGHYDEDQLRALSLREGAILQTFPDEYQFLPPGGTVEDVGIHRIGRWIGNAVPPKLLEWLARA